jgi:hypothetical protein
MLALCVILHEARAISEIFSVRTLTIYGDNTG